MSAHTSKVRLYDLAKELKIDTKRLIEEVRREGVDVSVPSNSVSKELAEKIREKYFPKKDTAVKRAIRVVKKAARPVVEETTEAVEETVDVVAEPAAVDAEPAPIEEPEAPVRPAVTRVMRKLAPAARAEKPELAEVAQPAIEEAEPEMVAEASETD
ncbi:MAG TPA: translation initiation factor IF-2 N-terminal domain-containing protein, partial [Pyrinomonadaceae bacterium]|nr:translation initiation factor IF-2 N-terminal domain-containing protein [Pyrinomonadaceae bacterium]